MIVQKEIAQYNNSHCLFENKSWIRLVEFLIQENAIMKTRLSEVIYQVHDRETLAIAEHFQDRFCIKDDVFEHMISDLKIEYKNWKLYNKRDPTVTFKKMKLTHITHRIDMERLEQTFDILKKDYNTFLASLESSSDFIN